MNLADVSTLPWPAMQVEEDGSVKANQALGELLGVGALDAEALGRLEVRRADGTVADGDGLPWRRGAREEFSERQVWSAAPGSPGIPVRVVCRRMGRLGLLSVEPQGSAAAAAAGAVVRALREADPEGREPAALSALAQAVGAGGAALLSTSRDGGLARVCGCGEDPLSGPDPASARDLAEECQLRARALRRGALAALPLASEREARCVVVLRARPERGFDDLDLRGAEAAVAAWAEASPSPEEPAEAAARAGLSAVSRAARGREAQLPLRELLRLLVEQACKLTGARYGALGVLDQEHGGLEDFVVWGISDERAARIGHLPTGKGLLGAVIREGRTLRVPDISRDPRSSGMPPHHPRMKSFLGVPLRVGEQTYGNFYLTDKQGAPEFTEADARLLEAFSAQAALTVGFARQSEERRRLLDAVLRQAPHGILFFAPDDTIAFHNAGAERLLGVFPGHGGARPFRLLHPDGRPLEREELPAVRALRGELIKDLEVRIEREPGQSTPAFASAAPVRSETGALLGAVVVFQDISAFKELERVREEFSAVVAHDLRSPLQAILMQLEVLVRQAKGAPSVQVPLASVERMRRSGARLARLVGDLLDAARVEGARVSLERKPVRVAEAVQGLLKQLEPALGDHRADLELSGEAPPAWADGVRLDQVLTNLVENAAKYSAPGSPIRVEVGPDGAGVRVTVTDQGPGISPEDMPRLFDRYFQARRAREKGTGLGLGLYITKGLVEAHGGRLWVESTPGVGSSFHVWLPAPPEQRAAGEEAAGEAGPPA